MSELSAYEQLRSANAALTHRHIAREKELAALHAEKAALLKRARLAEVELAEAARLLGCKPLDVAITIMISQRPTQ